MAGEEELVQVKSFRELLDETLRKYDNRLIDAAAVIRAMIEIRKGLEESARRADELGLDEEELAFYDAVAENLSAVYDDAFLRELIHDVVATIKRNLRVDWTEPHRENIQAAVRSAVKKVLRKRGVKAEDKIVTLAMRQAEEMYWDWPRAA